MDEAEARYEGVRNRLDGKTDLAAAPDAAALERLREPELVMPPLGALERPFIAGLAAGMLGWLQAFGHPR